MCKWLGIGLKTTLLVIVMGIIMKSPGLAEAAAERDVTLVNIEFEGSKIWVPGPVVGHKGDTVKIKAINNVKSEPLVHGLAIEAYEIQVVIPSGTSETVEFKADKAGIFPIICQLHPAHVGTQLVVLE